MEELQTSLSKLHHSQQQMFLEFENILAAGARRDEKKALQKKLNMLEAKAEEQRNIHNKADTNNRQQLKSLQDEVEVRRTQKAAQAKLMSALTEELSHLGKEVAFLEEGPKREPIQLKHLEEEEALFVKHLALKITKVTGGWLQFVFTNINRQKPDSPYVFSLNLNENRKYVVADCQPEISDLEMLVDRLNSTNNLSIFVQSVRKRFTSMASK